MVAWYMAIMGVAVGVTLSAIFNGIGWLINKEVEKRRDAASVAKLLYDSVKNGKEDETEAVDKYWRIYKKLSKKFDTLGWFAKCKKECFDS